MTEPLQLGTIHNDVYRATCHLIVKATISTSTTLGDRSDTVDGTLERREQVRGDFDD